MKLLDSTKFWIILIVILVASFIGGVLGNWTFIYLLDKYYGVPGGSYLTNTSPTSVIVRDTKQTVIDQDNRLAQAVSLADKSSVKIFKKQTSGVYQPKDAVVNAVVMTSDGWLMAMNNINPSTNWKDYEAVTYDRKIYTIESVTTDLVSKINFIRLANAKNLAVSGLVASQNLSTGQTLLALHFDGSVEITRLSRDISSIYSSDTLFTKLIISNPSLKDAYLFDANGQLAGVTYNGTVLAMNGVEKALEKLLTDGKITYSRLGINYLDLTRVFDREARTGALITTVNKDLPGVIPGSPADKSGLKTGDLITAIDDVQVNEFNNLTLLMQDYVPGDTVSLTVRRGKEAKKFLVKLDELMVE